MTQRLESFNFCDSFDAPIGDGTNTCPCNRRAELVARVRCPCYRPTELVARVRKPRDCLLAQASSTFLEPQK